MPYFQRQALMTSGSGSIPRPRPWGTEIRILRNSLDFLWVVIFETKRTDCRLALQRRVPINVDPVRRLRRQMTGFAILSVVERRCGASPREGERTGGD